MAAPAQPRASATCAECNKQLRPPFRQCSRCQQAIYCSRGCQRRDWLIHRQACDHRQKCVKAGKAHSESVLQQQRCSTGNAPWSGPAQFGKMDIYEQANLPTGFKSEHGTPATGLHSQAPFAAIDLGTFSDRLLANGFATFDGVSGGTDWACKVALEIEHLHSCKLLMPSLNKLTTQREQPGSGVSAAAGTLTGVRTAGQIIPKPHVFELDLVLANKVVAPAALERCPAVKKFVNAYGPALVQRLNAVCPQLRLTGIDTIKVQLNEGSGGCFPMHYDTSSAISNRAVTALIYLNPDWTESHGGHLRLYPFPLEPTNVQPIFDRMAVFCATETLHRVLPSTARRLALSVWFAAEDSEALCFPNRLPPHVVQAAKFDRTLAKFLPSLMPRPNRRLLAKVLYQNEYRTSFLEAFGDNEAVQSALALDEQETDRAASLLTDELASFLTSALPFSMTQTDAAS